MFPKFAFEEEYRNECDDPERKIERNYSEKVVEKVRAVVAERTCEKVLMKIFAAGSDAGILCDERHQCKYRRDRKNAGHDLAGV